MIRDEIERAGKLDFDSLNGLPILDSFIKEVVRVNPMDKSKYSTRILEIQIIK